MEKHYFTSESVTQGHPDKICDLISDAVLDEILKNDVNARVACETVCKSSLILIMGEISTRHKFDMSDIARNVLKEIGYCNSNFGLTYDGCTVLTNIMEQSNDIAMGVDGKNLNKKFIGAGDQGLVFGYACNETFNFMPAPIYYAHELAKKLDQVRKNKIIPYLGPDGKTQVTVCYNENGQVHSISAVVVSAQHLNTVNLNQIYNDIKKHVIFATIPQNLISNKTKIFINPTGRFVVGGPMADSGLTGRKTIVDSYGGSCRHGGGAFSGKDPTKVDRSGAYMARYVAKNVVAANLAKKCEIQLGYVIGVNEPVSICLDTFNTSKFSNYELQKAVLELFDFSPLAIINKLNLLNPFYKNLACYGHFGRQELNLPWEQLDSVSILKQYFNQ